MATMIGTSNTNADRVRLNLNRLDTDLSKVTQRLSLGLQLPLDRPGDTGVASQLESQIRGLHSAGINIQNGVGILNVADSALGQIADIISSMFDLAVQAA